MPDPEEPSPFSSDHSMLASLSARRRWWSFGRNGAQEPEAEPMPETEPEDDDEQPFVAHSMLGLLASQAPANVEPEPRTRSLLMLEGADAIPEAKPRIEEPARESEDDDEQPFVAHSMLGALASQAPTNVEPEPRTRSLLALEGAGAIPEAKPRIQEPAPLVFGKTGLHSTVGELAGLEEHSGSPFPIERFILVSLLLHVILVVLLMVWPEKVPAGSKDNLFAALVPQPKDDSPIPVIFTDATGAPRENPKRSPLSDADRRAGGGDASRPKAASPYVPPSTGVAGLAPGPKGPRVPGSAARSRPGAASSSPQAAAEKRDAAAPSTEQKPSEFPSPRNPAATTTGPRQTASLTGLDTAIREAARGAIGGEGGTPQGDPEGGFVDSGPISFDTTWYDWGPYAAEMVRRIKLHWDVPELARLGWKGSLTVRFFILADGTVADAKILRGSGIPPFDFAAFQAIVKSSPFRPLPKDLNSSREGVTVTFFYNMRPESEGAGAK